jgi:pimeloyl-ACP methyl ester carboxylesterase
LTALKPGRSIVDRGSVPIAVDTTPGRDPATLFVHGTGFCKETWDPVVAVVHRRSGQATVAMDQRHHGDSGSGPHPIAWESLGEDVLAVIGDDRGLSGVGHSSGAAALAMAEIARPGIFSSLVLIEPIIFAEWPGGGSPLVEAALKRRATFDSPDEALGNFRSKRVFNTWTEAALDAYVRGGLRSRPDGRWELKCAPRDESELYRSAMVQSTWDHLPEIACPVLLMAGSLSETHVGPYLEALVGQFTDVELVVVEGASHCVQMEQPEMVADLVVAGFSGKQEQPPG